MTDEALARARTVLAQQPFSKLLGTDVTVMEDGKTTLELPLRDDLKQQHGFAHGGVVAYLADNAMAYAAGTVFDDVLTVEMKINFTRPAIGERLIARGEVVTAGRRQAVTHGHVFVVDAGVEKLCAVAQGTIMRLAQD